MKICLILALVAVSALAEPPVDNRYLPPGSNGGSFGPPSQTYGPPGGGAQRQTDAVFRSRPSSSYGAPGRNSRPNSQYLPPSSPSSQYGAPARPSSSYGAPGFGQGRQGARSPSTQYGVPGAGSPSQQYGAPGLNSPSQQYGAPGLNSPSQQYGAPGLNQPSQQYGAPGVNAPSQQYGAPGFGGGQGRGGDFGAAQSRAYLPPGQGQGGYDDGSNGEPANYNFQYMVKDDESGNDFGHGESRQGDRAEGWYYVLLPDGRKQTVEYEADQDGYRPKISYEDVGIAGGRGGYQNGGQGGYQSGGQGGYQNGGQGGYQSGGPY